MSWGTEKIGKLLKPSGHDRAGSNDYPVLSITMHEGLVDQSSKFKKRIASRDTASYQVVYSNELVVGFPIDEGVLGFQTKYPAGIVSPAYGIWKLALPEQTHIPYLEGYLRSGIAREIYASKMRGGVARRRTISKDEFLDIDIPFPPLDEQKRIAAVLDKADALRRQRQESLQLTEKLLQSVFIDMFGDPTKNLKGWPTCTLEDLCDKIVDCPHTTPTYPGGPTGYYCIRSSDIQNGKLDLEHTRQVSKEVFTERIARHEPKEGEVVYTREGGRLGFAAQIPSGKRICLGQRMMLFSAKPKVAANSFLANLLNSDSFRRTVLNLVGGGAAPRVNIKDLRTILVYRPPFELQQKFENVASILAEQEASTLESAEHADHLFSSVQQRAFRGELDLSRLDQEITLAVNLASLGNLTATATLSAWTGEKPTWSDDAILKTFQNRPRSSTKKGLKTSASFDEIWQALESEVEEPNYETVKEKVFEYVATGILEQRFDEKRKEMVFHPRP